MGLDKDLVDDFQAISIILALTTVWFGLQYQTILSSLSRPIPDGPSAKSDYIARLWQDFWYRACPMVLISSFAAYLLMPAAIKICKSGGIAFWDFDFIRTAWMFVLVMLLVVFGWSIIQFGRFLHRIGYARYGARTH